MKLFLFDLLCALLLSICNLVYPLIAKYIIEELAGQKEKINLILALFSHARQRVAVCLPST